MIIGLVLFLDGLLQTVLRHLRKLTLLLLELPYVLLAIHVGAVWRFEARKDVEEGFALLVRIHVPYLAGLTVHLCLSDPLSCYILALVLPEDFCTLDCFDNFLTTVLKSNRILQHLIREELVLIEF